MTIYVSCVHLEFNWSPLIPPAWNPYTNNRLNWLAAGYPLSYGPTTDYFNVKISHMGSAFSAVVPVSPKALGGQDLRTAGITVPYAFYTNAALMSDSEAVYTITVTSVAPTVVLNNRYPLIAPVKTAVTPLFRLNRMFIFEHMYTHIQLTHTHIHTYTTYIHTRKHAHTHTHTL